MEERIADFFFLVNSDSFINLGSIFAIIPERLTFSLGGSNLGGNGHQFIQTLVTKSGDLDNLDT
jgi:hypothetical protein